MEALNKISQLLPALQQSFLLLVVIFYTTIQMPHLATMRFRLPMARYSVTWRGIHCGGEGGWIRVAYLSMNDPSSQCPIGFAAIKANEKKSSVRNSTYGECAAITL